jgi:hypothetical protein
MRVDAELYLPDPPDGVHTVQLTFQRGWRTKMAEAKIIVQNYSVTGDREHHGS